MQQNICRAGSDTRPGDLCPVQGKAAASGPATGTQLAQGRAAAGHKAAAAPAAACGGASSGASDAEPATPARAPPGARPAAGEPNLGISATATAPLAAAAGGRARAAAARAARRSTPPQTRAPRCWPRPEPCAFLGDSQSLAACGDGSTHRGEWRRPITRVGRV